MPRGLCGHKTSARYSPENPRNARANPGRKLSRRGLHGVAGHLPLYQLQCAPRMQSELVSAPPGAERPEPRRQDRALLRRLITASFFRCVSADFGCVVILLHINRTNDEWLVKEARAP